MKGQTNSKLSSKFDRRLRKKKRCSIWGILSHLLLVEKWIFTKEELLGMVRVVDRERKR
jgi:hypothetical protein